MTKFLMERIWLRWLLFLPLASLSAIISGYILQGFNRIGVGKYLDSEGLFYKIWDYTLINAVSGFVFIFVSIYIIPKYKKNSTILLLIVSLLILILGSIAEIKLKNQLNYWSLYGYIVFLISQYFTYKYYKEKNFETNSN